MHACALHAPTPPKAALALVGTVVLLAALCAAATAHVAHAASASQALSGYVSHVGAEQADPTNQNPSGTPACTTPMEVVADGVTLTAICAEHEAGTPSVGSTITNLGTVYNDDMRRVMYYGYGGPDDRGFGLVSTATALSAANGHMVTSRAWDMVRAVRALPAPPTGYVVTLWSTGGSTQNLCTGELALGRIDLQKVSSNATITSGNDCYGLEGATYGIYANAECTLEVGSIVANATGYGVSGEMDTGAYYVREKPESVPRGYAWDATAYPVTVQGGKTVRVNAGAGGTVADAPLCCPVGALIEKRDGEQPADEDALPQGSASLAGAQFTLCYYDSFFETAAEAAASGVPARTWVMQTDENGQIDLQDGDGTFADGSGQPQPYQIGGDAWYYHDGLIVLPLGTVTIVETQAPAGYLLPSPNEPALVRIVERNGAAVALGEGGATHHATIVPEQVVRGGLAIAKVDSDTGTTPQGDATFAGIRFEIVNGNPHPVLVGGTWFAPGEVITTLPLVTNESGRAATASDALPFGTYTVRETAANDGMRMTAPDTDVLVEADGQVVPVSMANDVVRGDYRLVKEVPTTSDPEAQELSRLVVQGVQFQFINESERAVVSPETHEATAPGSVACTVTTDENGLASTKAGAAVNGWDVPDGWTGALAFGTYRVHEVIPDDVAARYHDEHGITVLPVEDWLVTISEDGQYHVPTVVANHVPQTPLAIVKVDAETDMRIPPNCSFQLYLLDESSGTETLVTYANRYTESGEAETLDTWTLHSGKVTLPMKLDEGTYVLREVQAPHGYVLDATGVMFVVDAYRTWDDPLEIAYENSPVKGEIEIVKTDAATGTPVLGAEYSVRAAADIVTGDGTVRATAGSLVASGVATNDEGLAKVEGLYPGSYLVYETKAPNGYALDMVEHAVEVTVLDQTTPVVTTRANVCDAPTTIVVNKVSREGQTPLPNATFRIWQDEDDSEYIRVKATNEGSGKPGSVAGVDDDKAAEATDADGKSTSGISGIESADDTANADKTTGSIPEFDDESARASYDETFLTNEDGQIALPYLRHGRYHLAETEPAPGFSHDNLPSYDFVVNDQGLVGLGEDPATFSATLSITCENAPITLGTTAADQASGTRQGTAAPQVTIVDKVAYAGLADGRTYTIVAMLMDRATGTPHRENGQPVTAAREFAAQGTSGIVDVELTFDGSALANSSVVVFETLYDNGVEVATHADINNERQTVSYAPPKPAPSPRSPAAKTGDPLAHTPWLPALAAAVGATALVAAVVARRMRKHAQRK